MISYSPFCHLSESSQTLCPWTKTRLFASFSFQTLALVAEVAALPCRTAYSFVRDSTCVVPGPVRSDVGSLKVSTYCFFHVVVLRNGWVVFILLLPFRLLGFSVSISRQWLSVVTPVHRWYFIHHRRHRSCHVNDPASGSEVFQSNLPSKGEV